MTAIIEICISGDDFALGETMKQINDVEFRIEQVAASIGDQIMPYIWIRGTDRCVLERALSTDPTVETFDLLIDLGDEWLYRIEWIDRTAFLIEQLLNKDTIVHTITGSNRQWHLRLLILDREMVSLPLEINQSTNARINITKVYELQKNRRSQFCFTEEQQEALAIAFKRGYYSIPRRITSREIADELDITHQSVSERLRRAHRNLIMNTVYTDRGTEEDTEPGIEIYPYYPLS